MIRVEKPGSIEAAYVASDDGFTREPAKLTHGECNRMVLVEQDRP